MNSKSKNQMTRSQKPLKYPRELLKYFKFLWSKLIKFRSWALFRIWNAVFRIHTQSRSLVPQWDMTSQCESQSKIKSSKCFAPTILPIKHSCLPLFIQSLLRCRTVLQVSWQKNNLIICSKVDFFGCTGNYSNPKTFCCEISSSQSTTAKQKNWDPPTISMTSIQSWLLNVAPCLPKKKRFVYCLCFKRPSIEANTIVKYDEWFLLFMVNVRKYTVHGWYG